SIHASDLPADLKSLGARTLRDYLEYAERGPDVLERQRRDAEELGDGALRFESPFEEVVHTALTAKGLALATQVGCSGYRIDLAVRDPRDAGRFLLGIECDGAMYHSSKTARDRDRLRQQHLERMGWRIHRIWSRDWIRDPAGEVTKALRAVEEAQVEAAALSTLAAPPHSEAVRAPAFNGARVPLRVADPVALPERTAAIPSAHASSPSVTIRLDEAFKNGNDMDYHDAD
ncbi:MAG TPA: hypothetical protein VKT52_00940, partial [Ktedonobacterales bacterium]|nr:hypothetical protein [Ktedonobacterales bacterium]